MDSTTGSRKAWTAQWKEDPARAEGTREASCGKEYLSGALKDLIWYRMQRAF